MNTLADDSGSSKEDKFKGHTTRCPPDVDVNILQAGYTGFKHQMYMMRYEITINKVEIVVPFEFY